MGNLTATSAQLSQYPPENCVPLWSIDEICLQNVLEAF
jgi:hypothetical protein